MWLCYVQWLCCLKTKSKINSNSSFILCKIRKNSQKYNIINGPSCSVHQLGFEWQLSALLFFGKSYKFQVGGCANFDGVCWIWSCLKILHDILHNWDYLWYGSSHVSPWEPWCQQLFHICHSDMYLAFVRRAQSFM